jgi:Family of unknown function (DUF5923)/Protein of unknown function (DUF4449)
VTAYESLRTVGSLLLTNSDFRLFLADVNVIGRQVFADTANKVADVAHEAAEQVEPNGDAETAVKAKDSESGPPPTTEDLEGEVADVAKVVGNGLKEAGKEAGLSLKENVSGGQKETLLNRLKQAVLKLRQRNDYSDSVSTIAILIQRYAKIYSRGVDKTISTVQDDVEPNEELDRAIHNFWSLVQQFGDKSAWEELEKRFNQLMSHSQKDPEFESLMTDVGNSVQKLLTDPDFFEQAGNKLDTLREKTKGVGSDSDLRKDIDRLLEQLQITYNSVVNDKDVSSLIATSTRLFQILSPVDATTNKDLIDDSIHILLPLAIQMIQYIPIPRLEISVPEIDLLLENLILEPGRTVNHSSFLPFKLRVETYNDLEIRKAKFGTATSVTSLVKLKLDGFSIRADELGFWFRAHSGLFRLADAGIASFELDERGLDIEIDVEIGKERLESILTLRDVKVKIHHLNYTLRKSKFACLAWFFKPLLRPIIRKVMETQISSAIADGLHAANRELLFARERLRATRISDPEDVRTFIRAIITRLTPKDDPDMYTSVGVDAPGKGVFAGVYAPGSVVKLWNEEAAETALGEVVADNAVEGWRNEVFDVTGRPIMGSGVGL